LNKPIDFVICWVDGNDKEWQEKKRKFDPGMFSDSRDIRYRDWDNLQYWFRGVEKFAPWVNKIHFVTYGHIPSWLDVNHPKINIVKHEDYIPEKYLPTFSARPIEINLHRIKGLAEQFVYFNDDMFIVSKTNKIDFFKDGKPCDIAAIDIAISSDDVHGNAKLNSVNIINKYFSKKQVLNKNNLQWYNLKYGKHLMRTILLTPWKIFTGFYTPHLPNSFLKRTFEKVWDYEYEILKLTSSHKFREKNDVTQYLFKFWQLVSGEFVPRKNIGKHFKIGINQREITSAIEKQKYKIVCLNDNDEIENFEESKNEIINSFNKILSRKSSFEL